MKHKIIGLLLVIFIFMFIAVENYLGKTEPIKILRSPTPFVEVGYPAFIEYYPPPEVVTEAVYPAPTTSTPQPTRTPPTVPTAPPSIP